MAVGRTGRLGLAGLAFPVLGWETLNVLWEVGWG